MIPLLFLLFFIEPSSAVEGDKNCIPPSVPFFEGKMRKSFGVEKGEKELRAIVLNAKNSPLREEVKELKRKLLFVHRRDANLIGPELKTKYDQMISNAETEEVIANFPNKGASSIVSSSEEGFISISMNDLSPDELVNIVPPQSLKKLENRIRVEYKYPYDTFNYYLTYDGKELPLDKTAYNISEEFERECKIALIEKGQQATGAGASTGNKSSSQ